MNLLHNLPASEHPRIVIIGGGFAGIHLARKLAKLPFQVVLLDRHNYHQFQPLFYQVATAAIEPAAISFPLRRLFHSQHSLHFRMCEINRIDPEKRVVSTDKGDLSFDHLVIATGVTTNYYGNEEIRKHSLPMKSVAEALRLRNHILLNYERALDVPASSAEQKCLMNVVIAGGGPTGVELAGALAELRRHSFPKDYPSLDFTQMDIVLVEGSNRLLSGLSDRSASKAEQFLQKLGVEVRLNTLVTSYDGSRVQFNTGDEIVTRSLVWAAGVTGIRLKGLNDVAYGPGNRLRVDRNSQLVSHEAIYAIGDASLMETEKYPSGHPQVAQVAIQQGTHLAKYFRLLSKGKSEQKPFVYMDKGSMATVGKHLAVADLPGLSMRGWLAWLLWLFVHLFAILGTRNKLITFFNWAWAYFTADQSLRLLIVPKKLKS